MTEVIARIKIKGNHFEILVDAEKAIEMKKTGRGDISNILSIEEIFTDVKKGLRTSKDVLETSFGTPDITEIAKQIILKGEIQVPAEIREKLRGEKFKQIVDFLVKNSVNPQNNRPYTPERIERAIDEVGVNISNKPIESKIKEIISALSKVLPIKVETKKLKITIPAKYTGYAYGMLNNYKESEEWKNNGDLIMILNVPAGFQMEFYDKLNSLTHGNAISEEIKGEDE
ncbi:MAG: ribosome assembly factor SBDS [Candidatus Pacearchaeota archaeon]